ncbi:L-aspartate oxidase [Ruania zhangjianzhongii]|uniref:L-aspartate oxidase n=1 Tax=Ruania zhangjianzhongii TaxID=2603206 RepID=UPI0011C92EE4|nr:FAD-dependent oxidoreductase [Ruania zhangjianzhongii]
MPRVLIVGTGIAGLTAALTLAGRAEVTVVTKAGAAVSNTGKAQGGIAAVTSADDRVALHVQDTLTAGAGWSDRAAVQVLCAEGPARIADLIEAGVRFDTADDGALARGLEAAHSRARVLHAGGDATGAVIAGGLLAAAARAGVQVREQVLVTELLRAGRRVVGARLVDLTTGRLECHESDAVVLASGGAGQLYPYTSNPGVATGDGVALAARAGAGLADLELYQFHPTTLALPGNFLVSEAVRGEGAVLRDVTGQRFMLGVHPDAELAPRDVVARAVAAQMLSTGAPVTLDATALGEDFLRRRFPSIDAAVRAAGLDWAHQPVPVTPAAHYWMGGVATDLWARTSVPGLLAVGEVACTQVHGANRLASNSLLEGAVFGHRAARVLLGDPAAEDDPAGPQRAGLVFADASAGASAEALGRATGAPAGAFVTGAPAGAFVTGAPAGAPEPFSRAALQELMWTHAGLIRDENGLAHAEAVLERRAAVAESTSAADPLAAHEDESEFVQHPAAQADPLAAQENANLLLLARLVVRAARTRTSSLGAHFRGDAPAPATGGSILSPELVLETH